MTAPNRRYEAYRALVELGPTSRTVAMRLRKMGCKGIRQCSDYCPVAQYLTKRIGSPVRVDRLEFSIGSQPRHRGEMPDAVRWFAYEFDNGRWPSLEDKS